MSQPRVTVTVGHGGQRSATISPGRMYTDHSQGALAGGKRSLKDRLGASSINVLLDHHPLSTKRQHLESGWKQRVYQEVEGDVPMSKNLLKVQNFRHDLRYKLDQKHSSKPKGLSNGLENVGSKVQQRISGPLSTTQGQRIVVRQHYSLPPKAVPLLGHLPLPAAIASHVETEQSTVAALLQSIGLGKYSITFQAEEIDMIALRNMNDDDLKELGLPMGPRKKILIALASQR